MKQAMFVAAAIALVMVVGNAEWDNHTCPGCNGFSHDCNQCDPGRCCSPAGYCGSTDPYCTPCQRPTLCDCYKEYCSSPTHNNIIVAQELEDPSESRHNDKSANATHHTTVATYASNLATTFGAQTSNANTSSVERVVKYGWATMCTGSLLPSSYAHHPQCLKVTNGENYMQVVVKVMHKACINESLVLDYDVFQQLDDGNMGKGRSQLRVDYQYVNCIDE